jgi:hypothetical protein
MSWVSLLTFVMPTRDRRRGIEAAPFSDDSVVYFFIYFFFHVMSSTRPTTSRLNASGEQNLNSCKYGILTLRMKKVWFQHSTLISRLSTLIKTSKSCYLSIKMAVWVVFHLRGIVRSRNSALRVLWVAKTCWICHRSLRSFVVYIINSSVIPGFFWFGIGLRCLKRCNPSSRWNFKNPNKISLNLNGRHFWWMLQLCSRSNPLVINLE